MILPPFRTEDYAIWSCCERFQILPPGCARAWDDCDVWARARLIAFNQVRSLEDAELEEARLKRHG